MRSWNVDFINLDWQNNEGFLYNIADAYKVACKFKQEGVDAVFGPHCNFGTVDAVGQVGKLVDKPFLIWGPRDPAPLSNGNPLRDTQCGLFATSKIFKRFGVPFTYIPNSNVNSIVFERGFKNFLAVASVVKHSGILELAKYPHVHQLFGQ